MNKFKFLIGDYSYDGHNVVKPVYVTSMGSMEDIHKAYDTLKSRHGIDFGNICCEYADNYLTNKDKLAIEKLLGESLSGEYGGMYSFVDADEYVKLLLDCLNKVDPNLSLVEVGEDVPAINGWNNSIRQLGYGLFA